MATINDIVRGLNVIAQYAPKGMEAAVEAQHDILFADPNVTQAMVTPADATLLEQLGWHWDAENDCWARFT